MPLAWTFVYDGDGALVKLWSRNQRPQGYTQAGTSLTTRLFFGEALVPDDARRV